MTKMSLITDGITLVAQAAPTSAGPGFGGGGMMIVVYGLLFVGMYFLMIAPQRKKQKELEKMIASLGTGDEIVTTGGIYGTITNVKDDRFVVRIADNTKIEIGKAFIGTVLNKAGAEKK
jgi:preprotein translocase subunit YajC